ncbi:MAG: UDP-N-acetylmuramate--L-alanine ligase [Geminicoccaceae bacterium]|nr:UDP-N-acetylmuramate--L-alanine ligase [Geminicoccaceae bacterium]MDW8370532.1 UDP-N-acetylmuramate--L-alanine ligase [Geminicoccaceae bacterium]
MRLEPRALGAVHFIGIGGIGMSGIAGLMRSLGFTVQGSDVAENANVQRLRAAGVPVAIGHRAENLGEARVVVFSSAVKPDNPELVEARARRLPVVRRADMLAELMRFKRAIAVAGTHGKTTTTAMIAALLDAAGLDPTVVNGGIINAWGTNARLGTSDWMVVESDESDGSFLRLPAEIGVVTNIDPEHMDYWGDFDAVRAAYKSFVERLPFYGFGVLCLDHPEVQALLPKLTDRRVVTYGFSPQADVRAAAVRPAGSGSLVDLHLAARPGAGALVWPEFAVALPGRHNVQNALAAVAIGLELGLSEAVIRRALAGLEGVKRRFTVTGEVDGITVIDDYGHHPAEIAVVLATARERCRGRVLAVLQPHRFTRLRDLMESFATSCRDADLVLVAPVYPAGEAPIEGVDHEALARALLAHGQRRVETVSGPEELYARLAELAEPGDMVVCLGAGSITQWANALPGELARRRRARQA